MGACGSGLDANDAFSGAIGEGSTAGAHVRAIDGISDIQNRQAVTREFRFVDDDLELASIATKGHDRINVRNGLESSDDGVIGELADTVHVPTLRLIPFDGQRQDREVQGIDGDDERWFQVRTRRGKTRLHDVHQRLDVGLSPLHVTAVRKLQGHDREAVLRSRSHGSHALHVD